MFILFIDISRLDSDLHCFFWRLTSNWGVWRPNAVSCFQFAPIEIWKLHLGLWGFGAFRRTRILPPRTDRVPGSFQADKLMVMVDA